MDGKSLNLKEELIEQLKQLVPSAFTEGKLDINRLKLALGEDALNQENERYQLSWAGKTEAYRVLQEPSIATLRPEPEKSINFDTASHIFIEGENLQVLKVLQKTYFGKVKMIYIDPPYNTGNDSFIYPDRFSQSKEEYLKSINDLDDNGQLMREGFFRKNNKENGHYHSNWLSMMLPRLYLARNLLRDDGVIFVSIDDNEMHNLHLLMDEVFGDTNFVATFTWQRRTSSALAEKQISTDHEYIICYQKSNFISLGIDKNFKGYSNPDNDPRGDWTLGDLTVGMTKSQRPNQYYDLIDPETGNIYPANPNRVWAYAKETMVDLIDEARIVFPKNNNQRPMLKRFKNDLKSHVNPLSTWLNKVGLNSQATKELQNILEFNVTIFPKPVNLLKTIMRCATEKNDTILDFFAGSGTTAQAVMELNKEDSGNRQFICVQLPEGCAEDSEAYKAGYQTIADICRERIRRVVQNLQEKTDLVTPTSNNLGFKSFKLAPSNFKQWWGSDIDSAEELAKQMQMFVQAEKPGAELMNMAYELLLKNGQPLTTELTELTIVGHPVISANHNHYLFVLADMTMEMIHPLLALKPKEIVFLDSVFHNSDDLKVNTRLQCKHAGIRFTSI